MFRKTITRLGLAAVVMAAAGQTATAGLLPTSVTVNNEGDKFRWTYAIVLPTDSKLQSGNYFTVYDFDGYVPGSESAPEGWAFSAVKAGPIPDRLKPNDDANLWNLTWKYTGATIPSGQLGLGNFWAVSDYDRQAEDFFTAITNRTSDGLTDSNITDTIVPTGVTPPPTGGGGGETPPPAVPEPTTLALAALGLPLVGLSRALRRKK